MEHSTRHGLAFLNEGCCRLPLCSLPGSSSLPLVPRTLGRICDPGVNCCLQPRCAGEELREGVLCRDNCGVRGTDSGVSGQRERGLFGRSDGFGYPDCGVLLWRTGVPALPTSAGTGLKRGSGPALGGASRRADEGELATADLGVEGRCSPSLGFSPRCTRVGVLGWDAPDVERTLGRQLLGGGAPVVVERRTAVLG